MNVQDITTTGIKTGLIVGVIPVTITALIACSKKLIYNIIAALAIRILTNDKYTATVHNVPFVAVPLLWKVSLVAAIIGGSMIALSFIASLTHSIYLKYKPEKVTE